VLNGRALDPKQAPGFLDDRAGKSSEPEGVSVLSDIEGLPNQNPFVVDAL
jgi:hypothetical protein